MSNLIKPDNKPAWVTELEEASGQKIDEPRSGGGLVMLAIDCSGSMAGGNLEQAKKGALNFARNALKQGYSVGLLKFETYSSLMLEPCNAIENISSAINRLEIGGSTDMSSGIDLAATTLAPEKGQTNVICLVTDGVPNSVEEAIFSAESAKQNGIEIMAVGTDDADWDFLSKIVTRKELAVKVEPQKLGQQISDMTKLLPGN